MTAAFRRSLLSLSPFPVSRRASSLCLAFCLFLRLLPSPVAAETASAARDSLQWVRADETVVPVRADISRNGAIRGFLRKGQVVRMERATEHWMKVRVDDSIEGWVPAASMAESGPPVHLDPGWVKRIFLGIVLAGLAALAIMGIAMQRRRRAESEARARQALADARRRLQNKLQLLFSDEPRIPAHLDSGETPLREFLQSLGYTANLEADPGRFLDSSKAFKPNLIVADAAFMAELEKRVEADALLINTPVVYLRCSEAPPDPENRVRAYLDANVSQKDLAEAISSCLKRSPGTIRYSVKPVALKGPIQAGTLLDLLQFLASVGKTGQLVVEAGSDRGEVLLQRGEIAKAGMNGLHGARAVEELLDLAEGSFEFHERKSVEPPPPEGALSTQKVLMDWAKAKDEADHHSRA